MGLRMLVSIISFIHSFTTHVLCTWDESEDSAYHWTQEDREGTPLPTQSLQSQPQAINVIVCMYVTNSQWITQWWQKRWRGGFNPHSHPAVMISHLQMGKTAPWIIKQPFLATLSTGKWESFNLKLKGTDLKMPPLGFLPSLYLSHIPATGTLGGRQLSLSVTKHGKIFKWKLKGGLSCSRVQGCTVMWFCCLGLTAEYTMPEHGKGGLLFSQQSRNEERW